MHYTSRAFWLSALFWALLIWTLSSVPDLKSGLPTFWDFFLRKLAHAIEFGILFILLFRASSDQTQTQTQRRASLLFAVTVSILYAMADEWHQTFTPGRVGSSLDIGIDTLGIFLFAQIFRKKRIEPKKAKPRSGA